MKAFNKRVKEGFEAQSFMQHIGAELTEVREDYESFHKLATTCFQTFIYYNSKNTHNKT